MNIQKYKDYLSSLDYNDLNNELESLHKISSINDEIKFKTDLILSYLDNN